MVKSSKALLMIVKGERVVRQMPVASCVQRKNFKSTADDELDMLLLLAVSEDQVFSRGRVYSNGCLVGNFSSLFLSYSLKAEPFQIAY